MAVDPAGNAYVGGWTRSRETSFPVRVGPDLTANDPIVVQPPGDGFVAKVALVLLEGAGTARPGGTVELTLTATAEGGLPYVLASSLGTGPIQIGTRRLGLGYDGLFWISASGLLPGIFVDYRGTIGAGGRTQAALRLPAVPASIGLRIHSAFVTLEPLFPSGVRSISNTYSFAIGGP